MARPSNATSTPSSANRAYSGASDAAVNIALPLGFARLYTVTPLPSTTSSPSVPITRQDWSGPYTCGPKLHSRYPTQPLSKRRSARPSDSPSIFWKGVPVMPVTASTSPISMRNGRIQWAPPSMTMPPPVVSLSNRHGRSSATESSPSSTAYEEVTSP